MVEIEKIKALCKKLAIRPTKHALLRLLQRNITIDDVVYSLSNGEIIEEYSKDYPFPSCLVLGITVNKKYIHTVCSISEDDELWIITAYYPNPDEWENDYKTRKGD